MKMKTKISTIILAFTALVFNVQADSSTLPAPMPQFMNKEQLAKWNAEQAATYKPVAMEEEPPLMFFTGKPYIPDAGGYVYKYRTYNPEMLRWTSADPSGFPDGANCYQYAKNSCIGAFDPDGLNTQTFTDNGSYSITETYILSYPGSTPSASNAPTIYGTPVLSGPSTLTIGVATATLTQPHPENSSVTNEHFTAASGGNPASWTGTYSFQVQFTWTAGFSMTLWGQTIGASSAGTNLYTFTQNWVME